MKSTKRFFIQSQWLIARLVVLALTVASPALAQNGTWTTLTSMPQSAISSSGGVFDGLLYVASDRSRPLQVYNPGTNTWTLKASDTSYRTYTAAGFINGKLYVANGAFNADWNLCTNLLNMYDPVTDTYVSKTSSSTSRATASYGVIDGKLYLAGGCGSFPYFPMSLLEVYDPAADTWTSLPAMPQPQRQAGSAVIDGKLYVIGGIDYADYQKVNISGRVQVYDPATNTWTSRASMPTPRFSLTCAVLNGVIYAIGGGDTAGYLNTVEAYDPVSDTWTACTPMPTARAGMTAGVINGALYVAGGGNENGEVKVLEVFKVDNNNTNHPPTANAGPSQTIQEPNTVVTLTGSGSTDPDGDTLTYAWSFVSKPDDSAATLSDPVAVNPTFIVDREGNYVLQLVVTDSKGAASAPAMVTISTSNTKPVADATANPTAVLLVGTTVNLDGSISYDMDGNVPLTYQWSLSCPAGSNASLSYPSTPDKPTFVVDVHGDYYATLVVRDTWEAASDPKQIKISFDNLPPVADAGTAPSTHVGQTVALDGSGSSDPNNDALTYQWSLTTLPAGSSVTLTGAMTVSPNFTPDLPGTYVVQLVVTDSLGLNGTSTVWVEVVTIATWATEMIQTQVQPAIAVLDPNVFVNPNLKKTLMNKSNSVIAALQAGEVQDARDKLQNDILKKVDGCAINGAPDKNDWIKDCNSQSQVYQQILAVIQELGG